MGIGGKILSQQAHFIKGLDPVADAFAGTVYTDVVSAKMAHAVHFLIIKGVGAVGTTLVTVQACDDIVPTNRTPIPFKYRAMTAGVGIGDTWGALTNATAAGFTTTAGSSQRYLIEVDGDQLAASGYGYCQLKMVEAAANAVLGGVEIILWPLRAPRAVTASQIV